MCQCQFKVDLRLLKRNAILNQQLLGTAEKEPSACLQILPRQNFIFHCHTVLKSSHSRLKWKSKETPREWLVSFKTINHVYNTAAESDDKNHQSFHSTEDGAGYGSGLCDGRRLVQLSLLYLSHHSDPAQHLLHGVGGQRLGGVPDRTVRYARRLRRQVEHVVTIADWLRTEIKHRHRDKQKTITQVTAATYWN